jgi:hypothetical protein
MVRLGDNERLGRLHVRLLPPASCPAAPERVVALGDVRGISPARECHHRRGDEMIPSPTSPAGPLVDPSNAKNPTSPQPFGVRS